MPIESGVAFRLIDQEQFHAIDRQVMRQAFDVHNEIGRFCREDVYRDELAYRCRNEGLAAQCEIPIRVTHRDFHKLYFVDLLVEGGSLYELKTAEAFTGAHEKQLLNYLLLAELRHGKLINFALPSVEWHFGSTRLDAHSRRQYEVVRHDWQGDDGATRHLIDALCSLVEDWGLFLTIDLYRDGLVHFLGGKGAVIRPVTLTIGDRKVGTHELPLLDDKTAWHISAITRHVKWHQIHLERLLAHTSLARMQWINLKHHTITLSTLTQ